MISQKLTRTHRTPIFVNRTGPYATLLGWASTPEEAEREAREFESRPPVSFTELVSGEPTPDLAAIDRRILLWERRLLRFGRTDRADYIVHRLNLLRREKERLSSGGEAR